jgi:hypothetical protein
MNGFWIETELIIYLPDDQTDGTEQASDACSALGKVRGMLSALISEET